MRHALVMLAGAAAWTVSISARAADLPIQRIPATWAYDWSGLYVGGHVGYARGGVDASVVGAVPTQSSKQWGALYGGVQGGYNYVLPSGLLLGVETDLTFPNYLARDDAVWWRDNPSDVREKMDFMGSVRGRVGHAFDRWMVYGTGGFAYAHTRILQGDPGDDDASDKHIRWRAGWIVGAGAEFALDPYWSARIEYLYSQFSRNGATFASGDSYSSAFDLNTVRIGLNRKLGADDGSPRGALASASAPPPVDWEVHGQSTYIQQGYGRFRSPYVGANSFTPWPQTRETLTVSAFLAAKLWDGGEIYFNPELLQGFGLHDTTGAAGFPNGEAQKSNFAYPHYSSSRLFLRQTWGLGGEQEAVESAYGQMAGKRDISRVTVQVGKFTVHDVFDNNTYSSDPRAHFMNWALWAAGAFDYPADKLGLGYGAMAELNQKDWAWRAGYFLVGNVPNSNEFDMNLGRRGGYMTEVETRYAIAGQPGKLRLLGWMHETFSGSFREALDLVANNPGMDATDALTATRKGRSKYGYVVNLEQALSDDLGAFARWSWNSGHNEITAFTDIDASLSGGLVLKGTSWGRPDDKIGVGGAVNGLSKDERNYLAAGGLSVIIGDGMLNYRQEKILEAYYAIAMTKDVTFTLDYQFIDNLAYNADRGPVSIYAARLHAEF